MVTPIMAPVDDGTQLILVNVYLESQFQSSIRERINYAHDARAKDGTGERDQKRENNEAKTITGRNALEASARLTKLRDKFPITTHGMIKLSIFPDEAIDHAEAMLSAVYRAGEPYSYFLKLCKNYCDQNGIEIDWKPYYRLKVALDVANDDPVLDKELLDGMRELHKAEPAKKTYNKKESHKSQCNN